MAFWHWHHFCRPVSSQQRRPTTRSKNRSWWWCVWKNSVSVTVLFHCMKMTHGRSVSGVFTGLVCFSICQQAGGRPVRGAGEESGGLSPTTGGDQLTARSDCWPAGPLQRGERNTHTHSLVQVTSGSLHKTVTYFYKELCNTSLWILTFKCFHVTLLTFFSLSL